MNNRSVLKNNRGAALVSIMVAVAFVTILATAILSMSYNNFRMKVVNYESKANFYETEQRVTVMSTTLRGKAMASSTPLSDIQTLTGVVDNRYSAQKMAELAFPGSTAGGDASYATITGPNGDAFAFYSMENGANYLEEDMGAGLKKITFKEVAVKQTEAKTSNVNTIKTDIVMYIRESQGSSDMGGIGEFSVLSDAPLSSDTTTGTRINMFGNAFFMGTDFKTDHTEPGTALTLSGNCVYNILGDYNFAYGDIVLNDNAALNIIGGSLTVYGDIKLNGNSTLTCTGKLYMPCDEMGGDFDVEASNLSKQVYPATLVSNIERVEKDKCESLLASLKLNDNIEENDGITPQIFVDQTPVGGGDGTKYYFDSDAFQASDRSTGSVNIGGIDYMTTFFYQANVNGSLNNRLVFLSGSTEIQESNRNSTFISREPIKFSQAHSVNVSKMGSYAFDYMTLKKDDAGNNHSYNPSVHEITIYVPSANNANYSFNVGGFLDTSANETVKAIMGYAVNGDGGTPTYSSAIGYQNWSKE